MTRASSRSVHCVPYARDTLATNFPALNQLGDHLVTPRVQGSVHLGARHRLRAEPEESIAVSLYDLLNSLSWDLLASAHCCPQASPVVTVKALSLQDGGVHVLYLLPRAKNSLCLVLSEPQDTHECSGDLSLAA